MLLRQCNPLIKYLHNAYWQIHCGKHTRARPPEQDTLHPTPCTCRGLQLCYSSSQAFTPKDVAVAACDVCMYLGHLLLHPPAAHAAASLGKSLRVPASVQLALLDLAACLVLC